MALPLVRLVDKVEVADGTMSFHFEKPDGFTYKAGQFADYTLHDPPETDAEGNTRGFTLSSAPFEDYLGATTRMRDTAFKRVLKNAPIGTQVALDAPYGSFTLPNNAARAAVFLTGGIGVTPARSIILQAGHDKADHKIVLFYSNKRPEEAAYLDELTKAAEANENFTFVPTMDHMELSKQSWNGETGVIDEVMVKKYVADLNAPIYYLCGPRGMVTAMRALLNRVGVDDDDIRTEEFRGYSAEQS